MTQAAPAVAASVLGEPLRISVAMATYNGAKFLREQLDSIAAQTLQPYELVVTDDGSTDDTLAMLAEFALGVPFRVRVYPNPSNLGYADNFLRAASLCEGEAIAFCDQDDRWMPEKLQRCAQAFADPEVRLCVHSASLWDGHTVLPARCPDYYATEKHAARELYPLQGAFGFAIAIRKDLLTIAPAAERYRTQTDGKPTPHDRWFWLLGCLFGSVVLLSDVLALYRQHGGNQFGGVAPSTAQLTRYALASHDLLRIAGEEARCAAYFAVLAENTLPQWQEPSRAAADFLTMCSRMNHQRQAVYEAPTLRQRWASFRGLWRQGAYREERWRTKPYGKRGMRLRYRAALKDLIFGVSGAQLRGRAGAVSAAL